MKLTRSQYEILVSCKRENGMLGVREWGKFGFVHRLSNGQRVSEESVSKLVQIKALASSLVGNEIHFRLTPTGEELERAYAAERGRKRERGSE